MGTLGVAHRLTGNLSEAEMDLRSAISRDPQSFESRLNLIAVLLERGKEGEARANATEFLSLNPDFSIQIFSVTQPFKNAADLEHLIAHLRNAGLPE